MGFMGSLLGFDSGNTGGAGMNYEATGPAGYQSADSWANTQAAIGSQRSFLEALAQQNAGTFASQQALQAQLGAMAAGGGPNPAQLQFQDNANKIAAQTAGMIGSQKGMSPALQARLMAQQGAGAQQGIAGQAAALQAQQQMNAIGALQAQNAQMQGMQQNALGGYMQGALTQQGNVMGLQGSANAANAGVAQKTAGNQYGFMHDIGTGIAAAGSGGGKAHGGMIGYAGGGMAGTYQNFAGAPTEVADDPAVAKGQMGFDAAMKKLLAPVTPQAADPSSPIGDYAPGGNEIYASPNYGMNQMNMHGGMQPDAYAQPAFVPNLMGMPTGMAPMSGFAMACGGKVPLQGEAYANQMKPVPGVAAVPGDSPKNDTVHARLSPGEIIIPRSIALSPDAPEMAARFVAAVRAKTGRGIG